MKKLLFFAFSFTFTTILVLSTPSLVSAQTFDCSYNIFSGNCNYPGFSWRPNNRCGFTLTDDLVGSTCSQWNKSPVSCNLQTSNPCPSPPSPSPSPAACIPDRTPCNPGDNCCNGCFPNGFCGGTTQQAAAAATQLKALCNGGTGVQTALGCLPTNAQELMNAVFPWTIGLAGTAAFLLIAFGAFLHTTAAGDPEKLQKAKEVITSAVTGLLIIVFSVVLLKIIGVDILQLPGFG